MGAFAAGKRGMSVGSPEANRVAAVAIQELTGVLEGPYGAAERSCALQALLWTQVSPLEVLGIGTMVVCEHMRLLEAFRQSEA